MDVEEIKPLKNHIVKVLYLRHNTIMSFSGQLKFLNSKHLSVEHKTGNLYRIHTSSVVSVEEVTLLEL